MWRCDGKFSFAVTGTINSIPTVASLKARILKDPKNSCNPLWRQMTSNNNNNNNNNNNRLILNYHDAVLYESDLQLLQSPTAWLNDACMNFGMARLAQKCAAANVIVLDPAVVVFFMHQCVDDDEIREFINGNPQLQKAKLVFVPINNGHSPSETWHEQRGTHWSLLVIVRRNKSVQYLHFDSVSGSNARTAHAVANKLRQVLLQSDSTPVMECKAQQQVNGYDCGLHVLATVQLLASMDTVDETSLQSKRFDDMLHLRNILADEAAQLAKEYGYASSP